MRAPPLIDGIALAGGPGRRIGAPKATIPLGGITLIERAVAALAGACDRIAVVSRPEVRLPPLDAAIVFDRAGPRAPIVGLATGLGALTSDDCLVLACDLPLAAPLIARLAAAPPGRSAVAVDPSGRPQPLCARYPRKVALHACEELIAGGTLALHALLEALAPLHVPAGPDELMNVNTPEDLARAEAIVADQVAGSTSTTAL